MEYRRSIFFLGILCFLGFNCTGQSDEVKAAFDKKYPNAKKVKWEKDSHGYHEAKFELEDEDYRADFDAQGNWIETERSIDYDDLPKAVRKVIEDEYDEDDVKEVELVDHPTKGFFYDVELKDKGKKFDVELTPDGRIIAVTDS